MKLIVEGMTCEHCETTVASTLESVGMSNVEADWRRGVASGDAEPGFDPAKAAEALEAAGYRLAGYETAPSAGRRSDTGTDYDLAIIGSGSAAFAAAIKATELGARVVMIERDTIGGTCVNIGCVPSKALLRAAENYHRAGHSPFAGVETTAGKVDMAALVAQKDELVAALRKEKYQDLVDLYGFELIHSEAAFVDPETLEVDGRRLRAFRYLIATGAAPWAPPIEGLDRVGYLTSTTALELTQLPADLTVVGANAIGLELGQLFLHLGTKVTFVEALDRIAPFEEPEISQTLTDQLIHLGAEVITSAKANRAESNGGRRLLEIDTSEGVRILEADQLLVATGRRARTASLRLDAAGVETDPRGHVVVDDTMATSNPRVFAAGDVTTLPQFVYVAALSGNLAAENALRGTGRRIDLSTMPRVTFTTPQIASVGLTEAQAREAGGRVISTVLPLDAVPRALVDHETGGLVKLVADETSGRLLGAHLLAEGAGDVIQAAVMAIRYRATVDEIAETFHPYLTMAESLKLAAQSFGKDVHQLSCCAA